jgi:hypothetical protein
MGNSVVISRKEFDRLQFHLKSLDELLNKMEPVEEQKKPIKPKRVSFKKGVENYKALIESGQKRKPPKHLEK